MQESFKDLLHKITQILVDNKEKIDFPLKQHNELYGEIIQQVNLILENKEPRQIWQNYLDFFVQIKSTSIYDIQNCFDHSKNPHISEIKELMTIFCSRYKIKQKLIEFFVIEYLELIEPFKPNQESYDVIWNHIYPLLQMEQKESEFELPSSLPSELRMIIEFSYSQYLPYRVGFKTKIFIPLYNFLLQDEKSVSHENTTIRLSSKYQGEQHYVMYQDIRDFNIPQYTKDGQKRFEIDRMMPTIGGFSPYIFEITYEGNIDTKVEYDQIYSSLPPDSFNEDGFLTEQGLYRLRKFDNVFIRKLVDKGLQIEMYLELALKLFREGDVRIYGMYERNYPTKDIFSQGLDIYRPYFLEKKHIPDFKNPYIIKKNECEDFFVFWEIFYNRIFDLASLNTSLVSFYNTQEKGDDDEYLGYYRCVEILLTKLSEPHRDKWKKIKSRIGTLFEDTGNRDKIIQILNSLRKLRNVVGHEAFSNPATLNEVIQSLQEYLNRDSSMISAKNEIKSLLLLIFRRYWKKLEECNFNENDLLSQLDNT